MSVNKRGETWWYKFYFQGRLIRDSAKKRTNRSHAMRGVPEGVNLSLAVNRIRQRERMPMFEVAAQEWLDTKTGLAPNSHIRTAAKRAAIRSLEEANLDRGGAQNEAQSQKVGANYLN